MRPGRSVLLAVLLASAVTASLQPQRELQDHINQEVQELVRDRNQTKRLLFDDIFFGFGSDSDGEEKESSTTNCSCSQYLPLWTKPEDDAFTLKVLATYTNGASEDGLPAECGLVNQEIRIVGGRPTGVNRYPWVARIVYDGQFHCGGSLLNGDYVLTAAHCVRRLKRSKIRVILGDHNQYVTTDAPAIMRAVSAVIRHRNFDVNSYNHDIALLRLRKPVVFGKNIRPVCLPPVDMDPAGKVGTVVGWGRLSEGGSLATVVQEVQVPILSLQQCKATRYRPSRITPNMVCAGLGKEDSCQGDSGGPLLVNHEGEKYQIVGIVSWGVGCGRPGYPGVYTRVTSYLGWVKRNMRDSCVCGV